jgi:hypothetical protein
MNQRMMPTMSSRELPKKKGQNFFECEKKTTKKKIHEVTELCDRINLILLLYI